MPTIQQAVDHFLNSKRSDAPPWSDNTRHAYSTALSKFLSFLAANKGIDADSPTLLLGADPDVLLDYADWLLRKAKPTGDKGFSENTYQLYLTTARVFYLHLFAQDHLGPVTATALQQMLVKFDKKRKIPWKQKTVSLRRETKRHGPPQELVDRLLRPGDDLLRATSALAEDPDILAAWDEPPQERGLLRSHISSTCSPARRVAARIRPAADHRGAFGGDR